jgi:hypothetical protein
MLFTAVALSALAAVLASSAYARIPEGTGTVPTSPTVVNEQQAPQGSGTFFVDPEIYAALTSPTVANEEQTQQASGTFFVDAEICAALGRVRIAIQQCSHAAPLAATPIRTGKGQQLARAFPYESYLGARWQDGGGQALLKKFPDGYRGLP